MNPAFVARDLERRVGIDTRAAMSYAKFLVENRLTRSELESQLASIGYPSSRVDGFITHFRLQRVGSENPDD